MFAIFSGCNYIIKNKQVLQTVETTVPKKTIAQEEKETFVDEDYIADNRDD